MYLSKSASSGLYASTLPLPQSADSGEEVPIAVYDGTLAMELMGGDDLEGVFADTWTCEGGCVHDCRIEESASLVAGSGVVRPRDGQSWDEVDSVDGGIEFQLVDLTFMRSWDGSTFELGGLALAFDGAPAEDGNGLLVSTRCQYS